MIRLFSFRLNFSDAEIEIFCCKYVRDGNFEFTLDEINAIEQGLEEDYEDLINSDDTKINSQVKEDTIPPPTQGMLVRYV